MDRTSVVHVDRQPSIESEPRTLDFDQIQFAREAAMYVLNTRSEEEAMNTFTEGLKPVVTPAGQNVNTSTNLIEEDLAEVEKPREVQKGNGEDDKLLKLGCMRNVASAPF